MFITAQINPVHSFSSVQSKSHSSKIRVKKISSPFLQHSKNFSLICTYFLKDYYFNEINQPKEGKEFIEKVKLELDKWMTIFNKGYNKNTKVKRNSKL